MQSLPIRGPNCIRIFVFLDRAIDDCTLVIRRVVRNILSNNVLLQTTLVVEEEHFIDLLMIIFLQLLFSSEPDPKLFYLFFLSIKNRPKVFQLLLQLVTLLLNIFTLGLCNLLFVFHLPRLNLRCFLFLL